MKTRIIAAGALLPVLLVILIALPPVFTAVLIAAMAAVAAYELLWGTGLVRQKKLVVLTAAFAAGVSIWCYFGQPYVWGLAGVLALTYLLFGQLLISKTKLAFEKITVCLAGGLLVPYLLSAIVRIRSMDMGAVYVLLPFVLAFLSDTGAYFAGVFFGKHKLCPNISPKKTVEGFFGGILGAVIGVTVYGIVLMCMGFQVNFLFGIVYGVVGSLASVLGDLSFSVIKRQVGIKDYGNLIPGHGGILDRFDSMTVVAPIAELLLLILPLAVN